MTKKGINNLLVIMVLGLALIALLAGGVLPTICNGIVAIVKKVVPTWWTLLAYAYVGGIAFLLGMKAGMKNDENANT